jgi:hypothetical protein
MKSESEFVACEEAGGATKAPRCSRFEMGQKYFSYRGCLTHLTYVLRTDSRKAQVTSYSNEA